MTAPAGWPIRACGFTRFGQFWNDINQASQSAFRTWVEAKVPWLWTSVIRLVLDQPVFAVLGILGILLMILFRPRKPLIGYFPRLNRARAAA